MMGTVSDEKHHDARRRFRAFTREHVLPGAARWDQEQRLPPELIARMASAGFLAAMAPEAFGGRPLDSLSYGFLHEELGAGCSSARSLVTVHSMVCQAISRWGTPAQQAAWLPLLARGELVGAFALSEPNAGSDASAIETRVRRSVRGYVLDGRKKWITCGQIAGLFLVFAKLDAAPTALLVPADCPGLVRRPLEGMLGCRASMLAELSFEACELPESALLGRPGFALSHIAQNALDAGRFAIAWGCVGLLRACLEASVAYAGERRQFSVPIIDHQLVRRLITDMLAELKAARLLCRNAAALREARDPNSFIEVAMAKYYASTAAMRGASSAVQIHGASGVSPDFAVERWYRDAKVMELIEGSTQIQQSLIATHASSLLSAELEED